MSRGHRAWRGAFRRRSSYWPIQISRERSIGRRQIAYSGVCHDPPTLPGLRRRQKLLIWGFLGAVLVIVAPSLIVIWGGTPPAALAIAALGLFVVLFAYGLVDGYWPSSAKGASVPSGMWAGLRTAVGFWWSLGV